MYSESPMIDSGSQRLKMPQMNVAKVTPFDSSY